MTRAAKATFEIFNHERWVNMYAGPKSVCWLKAIRWRKSYGYAVRVTVRAPRPPHVEMYRQ